MNKFIFDTSENWGNGLGKKIVRGNLSVLRDDLVIALYRDDPEQVNKTIQTLVRSLLRDGNEKALLTGSEFYLSLIFHKDRNLLSKKLLDELYLQAKNYQFENLSEFRYLTPEFEKFLNTIFFGFSKFSKALVRDLIAKVITNITNFPPQCQIILEEFLKNNVSELENIFMLEDSCRFGSGEFLYSLLQSSPLHANTIAQLKAHMDRFVKFISDIKTSSC